MIKISEIGRDQKKMIYDTSDSLGTRLPNPADLGEGYAETGEVENGLGYGLLYVKKVVESQKLYVRAEPGRLKLTLHTSRNPTQFGIDGLSDVLDVHYGQGFLLSVPAHGIVNTIRGDEFHEFSLMVHEKLFCSMLDELSLPSASKCGDIIFHPDYSPGYMKLPTSYYTRMSTHQFLRSPLRGSLGRLYMETKLQELLVLRLYDLERSLGTDPQPLRLKRFDYLHVEEAMEILEGEAFNPPTIAELSRRVGLNTTKLKAGFRERFGTTIFGYVRQKRMESALEMLVEGNCNVSEVAFKVGYQSLSSFSKAFYNHHGFLPCCGRLRKEESIDPET